MKKQPNTLQKKLDAVGSLMSKAKESSATVEAQLKDMKSRGSGEGSSLGYNSAEKFQQKVTTIAEKKEPFSLSSLKNFKRQRNTVLETSNAQAVDAEIEKLLNQSGEVQKPATKKPEKKPEKKPKKNEDDEYEDDYEQEEEQEEEEEQLEEDQQALSSHFEDSEFGPNEKDPSGIKSLGPNISQQASAIYWPHMEQISTMGKAFFIQNKDEPNDPENSFWIKKVIQGHGDLDFLNALIFAATNEELFSRIHDSGFEKFFEQGVYVFKFCKNSNQVYYVIVDDKIPSIQKEDGEYVPIGARSDNGTDYWVSLIEKAYSKLHASYDNMCSNHLTFQNHFSVLTGLMVEEIPLIPSTLDTTLFWEFLTNFNKFKLPMACRQDNEGAGAPLKAATGHIYIIIDVLEEDENRMLRIANPWANAEELMETEENNGVYNVSYDDFLTSFSTFLLVKDFPQDWKGVKFECDITSSKGAPTTQNNLWVENPQYVFDVKSKEEGNIIIRLHRYVGIQSLNQEALGSVLGFAVFPLTQSESSLKTADLKRNYTMVKSNLGESWAVANLSLSQGKYSLIPFTLEKGETAFFYCELFFDFREDMITFNTIKKIERILEPCLIKNAIKQSWKPRVLKSTLKLSDFKGNALDEVCGNTLLFVPHTTSKILYKEGAGAKLSRTNTATAAAKEEVKSMGRGLSKTLNPAKVTVNRRLYDLKIDGQQDYEITAALFGLAPETTRASVKDKGAAKNNDETEELDYDILASLETVVDFNDFGLTDVGLNALLDAIIQTKKILTLKLAGNKLTDAAIVNMIDRLERSHHFELEELDLSNNNIGKFGGDLLVDMTKTFKNLVKIELNGNKDLSDQIKNTIKLTLRKKTKV